MTEDSVDLETVRDLCRDRYRGIVLSIVAEEQRPLTLNDLTKAIVRTDHDAPITETDAEVVEEIRAELDEQIPRLEDAGVLEYDPERGLVTPTIEGEPLQSHLATVAEETSALDTPADL